MSEQLSLDLDNRLTPAQEIEKKRAELAELERYQRALEGNGSNDFYDQDQVEKDDETHEKEKKLRALRLLATQISGLRVDRKNTIKYLQAEYPDLDVAKSAAIKKIDDTIKGREDFLQRRLLEYAEKHDHRPEIIDQIIDLTDDEKNYQVSKEHQEKTAQSGDNFEQPVILDPKTESDLISEPVVESGIVAEPESNIEKDDIDEDQAEQILNGAMGEKAKQKFIEKIKRWGVKMAAVALLTSTLFAGVHTGKQESNPELDKQLDNDRRPQIEYNYDYEVPAEENELNNEEYELTNFEEHQTGDPIHFDLDGYYGTIDNLEKSSNLANPLENIDSVEQLRAKLSDLLYKNPDLLATYANIPAIALFDINGNQIDPSDSVALEKLSQDMQANSELFGKNFDIINNQFLKNIKSIEKVDTIPNYGSNYIVIDKQTGDRVIAYDNSVEGNKGPFYKIDFEHQGDIISTYIREKCVQIIHVNITEKTVLITTTTERQDEPQPTPEPDKPTNTIPEAPSTTDENELEPKDSSKSPDANSNLNSPGQSTGDNKQELTADVNDQLTPDPINKLPDKYTAPEQENQTINNTVVDQAEPAETGINGANSEANQQAVDQQEAILKQARETAEEAWDRVQQEQDQQEQAKLEAERRSAEEVAAKAEQDLEQAKDNNANSGEVELP